MSNENHQGGQNFLSNGELIGRNATSSISFKAGDKFYLENETYLGQFLVLSVTRDTGVTFVKAAGAAADGDAVFDLAYLHRCYAKGKMKLYDEDGKLIDN